MYTPDGLSVSLVLSSFRCFAALGDVSKARYLHETNKVAQEAAKTMVITLLNDSYIWIFLEHSIVIWFTWCLVERTRFNLFSLHGQV